MHAERGSSPLGTSPSRLTNSISKLLEVIDLSIVRKSISLGYVAIVINPEDGKVADGIIIRSVNDIVKLYTKYYKYNVLIYPQIVRIPKYIYKNNKIDKIKLFKALKDDAIYYLSTIVLDIDDNYDDVINDVKEFINKFNINKYIIERTKNNRLRLYIPIEPILAYKQHNNKHKNIDNFRELIGIYISYFQKKGIKIDVQNFIKINQPIWLPEAPYWDTAIAEAHNNSQNPSVNTYRNTKNKNTTKTIKISHITKIVNILEGKNLFYSLYKSAKITQRELKLYYIKINDNKKINLTQVFWANKISNKDNKDDNTSKGNINIPKYVIESIIKRNKNEENKENRVNTDVNKKISNYSDGYIKKLYEKAVRTLSERYKSYRFIHIFLPAVGWAKYLGLEENYVYDVLRTYLPDKNNFDRDFRIAWTKAWELEFNIPKHIGKGNTIDKLKNTKYKDLYQKVLKFIRENKDVWRKDILALCYNQRWLADKILNQLHNRGLVEFEYVRSGKRGRPKKLIRFIEKNYQLQKINKDYIYNNLPKGRKGENQPLGISIFETIIKELKEVLSKISNHLFDDDSFYVCSYEKVLKLYTFLSQLSKPITIREIAKSLKLSKTSVRFLLKVLKDSGIVNYAREGSKGILITSVKLYHLIGHQILDFLRVFSEYQIQLNDHYHTLTKILLYREEKEEMLRWERKRNLFNRGPPTNPEAPTSYDDYDDDDLSWIDF